MSTTTTNLTGDVIPSTPTTYSIDMDNTVAQEALQVQIEETLSHKLVVLDAEEASLTTKEALIVAKEVALKDAQDALQKQIEEILSQELAALNTEEASIVALKASLMAQESALKVREATCDGNEDTWSPDLDMFDVEENSSIVAS